MHRPNCTAKAKVHYREGSFVENSVGFRGYGGRAKSSARSQLRCVEDDLTG